MNKTDSDKIRIIKALWSKTSKQLVSSGYKDDPEDETADNDTLLHFFHEVKRVLRGGKEER